MLIRNLFLRISNQFLPSWITDYLIDFPLQKVRFPVHSCRLIHYIPLLCYRSDQGPKNRSMLRSIKKWIFTPPRNIIIIKKHPRKQKKIITTTNTSTVLKHPVINESKGYIGV